MGLRAGGVEDMWTGSETRCRKCGGKVPPTALVVYLDGESDGLSDLLPEVGERSALVDAVHPFLGQLLVVDEVVERPTCRPNLEYTCEMKWKCGKGSGWIRDPKRDGVRCGSQYLIPQYTSSVLFFLSI